MKITRRRLKQVIRESFILREETDDEYFAIVKSPEGIEKLKAAGFTEEGLMPDPTKGLGPLELGMYTPQSQEELDAQIEATIEINAAMMDAIAALDTGEMQDGQQAYWEIILPVQQKWRDRGASDTEGRETTGTWLEDQGYEWGY